MFLANNYQHKTTCSLRVCRGCLATDVPLYDMHQNGLAKAYSTILSTAVEIMDDLPHYLCSYCAALLLKCDKFRIKCMDSLIVLRNAQQQNVDLTIDYLKVNQPPLLKQSVIKTIDITDKTKHKYNSYSDISTDSSEDISSDSDVSISSDSDVSLSSDSDVSSSSDSDVSLNLKEISDTNLNVSAKSIIEEFNDTSKNVVKNILKKYFGNKSGILKDFKVTVDGTTSSGDHKMKLLSDIVNHIQYSSESCNDIFKILDKDTAPLAKHTKKTNTKSKTAKTKHERITRKFKDHVPQDAIKTVVKNEFKSDIDNESSKDLEIKIELSEAPSVFETDEGNEDLEDDIAIADLKVESKCKKLSKVKHSEKIISSILKGQSKKVMFTEELYAMYNTEVKYLSKEEQLRELSRRKDSANYKNGPFKCNFCFKGFLIEETFNNHMSFHDDRAGKFVCEICQCHFMTKRRLVSHQKCHSKVFTCKECGHRTSHGALAAQHYKWHGGKKFSCEDCGKEFLKKSSKYGHIKMCHPTSDQLVRCEICGDSFNGLAGLRFHDNRSHKEMYSPECHCSVCETQFYCSDAFKAHRGTDGVCDTTHKYCVRCGVSFDTEELLKEHEIEQRKPQSQFKCEVCHKTFKFFCKLKSHLRRHSARKLKSVKKKEIIDTEEMICEVCGKLMKNGGLLKLHYNTAHTSVKPFKCTFCPKAFKTSALLVGHVRVHTGERPYQCHSCPKAFQNNQNLRRHNIVHTGERPHSCDLCGKSFQSKESVKLHIKTVHMKIPMPPRIRRRNKKSE